MESNPSATTTTIELNNNTPSYAPLKEDFDCRLLALIDVWDDLSEDVKATIDFIVKTSERLGVDA